MKKSSLYIVGLQFFILLSQITVAQFQPAPVVRSQEKTIVNGKLYYIHTVQKGQTLYSISKVYEVTQEEIKNANPQVDVVNLVEGLAIRIPETKSEQAVLYPENREDFYAHTVKRKETIYSLARKYKVDDAVIYYYNPWARDGIKPNQTLWIPRNKEMHDITPEARSNDAFYYYTTKEKDTLYSIARTYGVSISDIINSNPELRNGLRPKQVIKIPRIPVPGPEEILSTDTLAGTNTPCVAPEGPFTFNVALMLPFFATYKVEEPEIPADTLAEEGTYVPQERQQGLRGRNFAEFYEGFLLAMDSLKKSGMSLNLHVFDTERDTLKTKKIVRELAQIQPDLIIGPVYTEDVKITGRFARFQETQLISPLSSRTTLVERNTNIIQVAPSRQSESYAMANFLQSYKKGRIILIRGSDSISIQNGWRFKKYLLEHMPTDETGTPLYFRDYRLNDSLNNNLGKILSKEQENLLIVFSESEPEVNSLVTRLIQRASSYPVILFGMPSWQGWTNLDLTFLHNLQLHLIIPFYTDFTDPRVRNFLNKSRRQYGYEPYEIFSLGYNFSMLGYDIGFYFLNALKQYGKNFMPCIDQVQADQLLTRYHFIRTPSGGFVNNSFNVIRYNSDFSVEKIGIVNGDPIMSGISTEPSDTAPPKPLIPVLQ